MSSPTTSEIFWRQMELFNPDKNSLGVSLIGAGGLGSAIALTLTKMGVNDLEVYDGDVVDLHNLPNQFYRVCDVGKKKVDALGEIVTLFAPRGVKLTLHPTEYFNQELRNEIVILAVDDHAVRKKIYPNIRVQMPKLLIDARMGGFVGTLLAFNPIDAEKNKAYMKGLEGAGEELPCSARAIVFNVFMVGGIVASMVRSFAVGQPVPSLVTFASNSFDFLVKEA